jgi:hypothetical protein
MKFDQLIQYKTLDRMHSLSGSDLVDRVAVADDQKAQMKNVCALIHVSLFEELEGTCALLGLSKRQFIEACLIEGLARADKIVDEVGLHKAIYEHETGEPYPTAEDAARVFGRDQGDSK